MRMVNKRKVVLVGVVCLVLLCSGLSVAKIFTATAIFTKNPNIGGTFTASYNNVNGDIDFSLANLGTTRNYPVYVRYTDDNGANITKTAVAFGGGLSNSTPVSTNIFDIFGTDFSGNYNLSFSVAGTSYNDRDSQFAPVPMNIYDPNEVDTVLYADNVTINKGDSYQYKVRLTNKNGDPLKDMRVILTVNGVAYDEPLVTDDNGYGFYNFTNVSENLTVLAEFHGLEDGTTDYIASMTSSWIHVLDGDNPEPINPPSDDGGSGFNSLPVTGVPLLCLLLFLLFGGVYYYRK